MGVDQTTRFATNYLCEDGQETYLSSATIWACLEEKCTKEQRILFYSLLDGQLPLLGKTELRKCSLGLQK